MITDDAIDGSRNFILTYSLNDDSVCVKERVGAGRRKLWCCSDLYLPPSFFDEYGLPAHGHDVRAYVEKRPVKKSHNPQTTLPQYLQPEDLYVGAVVELRGKCFLLTEADEATLSFMEKYSQRVRHEKTDQPILPWKNYAGPYTSVFVQFPYSDIQRAVTKFFGALPLDRDAVSTLRSNFEDRDSSKSGLLDWDQFV